VQLQRWLLMAGLGVSGTAALAAAVVCLGSGCSSLGYYAQSVGGHLDLMNRARPVAEWVADPATPQPLRERLQRTQRMREFAVRELHLPDNASYRRFAELNRPAAVWNVVAAPELSLKLKTWCFPIMGCVGYRGYFSRAQADEMASQLRAEGWEVSVYGVPAYSTLGWTNWLGGDPLLDTFVNWPEGELARLLFHELSHQVVYVADDTMFNESFATAVERLGGQRWLQTHADEQARVEYEALDNRRQDFRKLTLDYRRQLEQLYASAASEADKRAGKARLMAALRADYEQLKATRWQGFAGYDGWFARANNAALGVQAAYNELVPGFEHFFEAQGRDFKRFYAEIRRLAALPRDERNTILTMPARTATLRDTDTKN
jgi:predicted aminopeptidase